MRPRLHGRAYRDIAHISALARESKENSARLARPILFVNKLRISAATR